MQDEKQRQKKETFQKNSIEIKPAIRQIFQGIPIKDALQKEQNFR